MRKTRITPCLLCGRDAPQPVVVRNGYPIVRCGGCGLVYVHPLPPEEDLPGFYGEYHARDGGNEAGWNRLMGEIFREAADHLDALGNGSGPPRLLDVGCGYGGFVALMRDRGWDAEGVDPSPVTVHAASAKGIPVRLGTLDEFSDSGASYRAITMFYVLEHLFDPMSALRKAFGLLEPGGVLLVRVPDTTPIVRLLSPFGWGDALYDPPFHLLTFRPACSRGCSPRRASGRSGRSRAAIRSLPASRRGWPPCCSARSPGACSREAAGGFSSPASAKPPSRESLPE